MDDLEKNQNTPDGESEQPAEEKSVFGGLFKAWSNASEESLLAEADAKKAAKAAEKEAQAAAEGAEQKTAEMGEAVSEAVKEAEPVKVAEPVKAAEPAKPSKPMFAAASSSGSGDKPQSNSLKKLLIGLGVGLAAIILIVIIVAVATGGSTINVSDYVSVKFSGADGYGKAEAVIDYTKMQADYGDKVKLKKQSTGNSDLDKIADAFLSNAYSVSDLVKSYSKATVSPSVNLKNGDEVKVTFVLNEKGFENATNSKIKAEEKTFKVEGLNAVTSLDPFDDKNLAITYEGLSGEGYINVGPASTAALKDLRYRIDGTNSRLKNGDTIKIVVSAPYHDDGFEGYCHEKGFHPTASSKEITLNGFKELESIDLFANVKVTFDGVNGYGTAEIDQSAVSVNDIKFVSDKTSELKNGDVVKVEVRATGWYDLNGTLKEQGYKTDVYSKEYTVSGLEELDTYDPYEDIELVYDGISGEASVKVEIGDSKEVQYFSYRFDKDYGLSNGDEIELTATVTNEAEFMEEFKLIPGKEPKKYTVSGLSHYLEKEDVLDDEGLKTMQEAAEDALFSDSSSWRNFDLDELNYLGYITYIKKDSGYGKRNFVDLMYELDMKYKSDSKDHVKAYTVVRFYEIVVTDEGAWKADISNYSDLLDDRNFKYEHKAEDADGNEYETWTLSGFEDLDGMKKQIINENRENYFYETFDVETKKK